jgi:hypothetical protein
MRCLRREDMWVRNEGFGEREEEWFFFAARKLSVEHVLEFRCHLKRHFDPQVHPEMWDGQRDLRPHGAYTEEEEWVTKTGVRFVYAREAVDEYFGGNFDRKTSNGIREVIQRGEYFSILLLDCSSSLKISFCVDATPSRRARKVAHASNL